MDRTAVLKKTLTYVILVGVLLLVVCAAWRGLVGFSLGPPHGLSGDELDLKATLAETLKWIAYALALLVATRGFLSARQRFLRSIGRFSPAKQRQWRLGFGCATIVLALAVVAANTWYFLDRAAKAEAVTLAKKASAEYTSIINDDGSFSEPADGVNVGASIPVFLQCDDKRYRLQLTCAGVPCTVVYYRDDVVGVLEEDHGPPRERFCTGAYHVKVRPTSAGLLRVRAVLTRGTKETQVLDLPPVPVRTAEPAPRRRTPSPG